MPFDQQNFEVKPDLSKPSVEGLIWLLRHKEAWPEDFEWDYVAPEKCGAGLGICIWKTHLRADITNFCMSFLGMPEDTVYDIFWRAPRTLGRVGPEASLLSLAAAYNSITPEDIATLLEQYISQSTPA